MVELVAFLAGIIVGVVGLGAAAVWCSWKDDRKARSFKEEIYQPYKIHNGDDRAR